MVMISGRRRWSRSAILCPVALKFIDAAKVLMANLSGRFTSHGITRKKASPAAVIAKASAEAIS